VARSNVEALSRSFFYSHSHAWTEHGQTWDLFPKSIFRSLCFLSFFLSLSTTNCERIAQHEIELLHVSRTLGSACRQEKLNETLSNPNRFPPNSKIVLTFSMWCWCLSLVYRQRKAGINVAAMRYSTCKALARSRLLDRSARV
jgi:hypothetical protein